MSGPVVWLPQVTAAIGLECDHGRPLRLDCPECAAGGSDCDRILKAEE